MTQAYVEAEPLTATQRDMHSVLAAFQEQGVIRDFECTDPANDKWMIWFGSYNVTCHSTREALSFAWGAMAFSDFVKRDTLSRMKRLFRDKRF